MSYKVKIDQFEGPFDLLVYLIETSEMNIYDIQVAAITRQYMDYIQEMQRLDVEVATEFMVLAAVLIEIKSKMLLPRIKPEGVAGGEGDPREELVERILEYKRFKRAAALLEDRQEAMEAVLEKPKEDLSPYTKEPDEYLNLDIRQFAAAFHLFLHKRKKVEEIRKNYARVERQRMTIEDRIQSILKLFRQKAMKKITFLQLVEEEDSRYNRVVTFVSLLEMAKQRLVKVKQQETFGEIVIGIGEEAGEKKAHDQ